MTTLEEEEEAGHFQDYMNKKEAHTYHPSVISCSWSFGGIIHNLRRELLIFFKEMSRVLLQGHKLLRMSVWYWFRVLSGWDTAGRPQVVSCSVGVSVRPISIRSTRRSCLHPQIRIETRVGRRIVPISLSQPAIICLLKIKKIIMKFNSRK